MRFAVFIVTILSVSAAFAEKRPISDYQSIIARQMFGKLPPGFDPTKSPSEVQKKTSKEEMQLAMEQEKLQSSIHFSVINVAADGQPTVGFTDNSNPKVPKHYFLKVGETKDGWTVKEADADKATMTIEKDGIEVPLTLGGNSASGGGTSRAGGAASTASAAANGGARAPRSFGGGLLGGGTMRARQLRRKQEAQEEAAKQQAEQAARDAERQALAEADRQQREQERAEMRRTMQELSDAIRKEREKNRDQKASGGENGNDGGANNETE